MGQVGSVFHAKIVVRLVVLLLAVAIKSTHRHHLSYSALDKYLCCRQANNNYLNAFRGLCARAHDRVCMSLDYVQSCDKGVFLNQDFRVKVRMVFFFRLIKYMEFVHDIHTCTQTLSHLLFSPFPTTAIRNSIDCSGFYFGLYKCCCCAK